MLADAMKAHLALPDSEFTEGYCGLKRTPNQWSAFHLPNPGALKDKNYRNRMCQDCLSIYESDTETSQ